MSNKQVAILIDFENIGIDAMSFVVEQSSKHGRIIINRAYADWTTTRGIKEKLQELGIEPIHNFRATKTSKNAADIMLAVDAVDTVHRSPVDLFVIVSSDSDFIPLIRYLKALGKEIIGAGRKIIVPDSLVLACDDYIYLDDHSGPNAKPKSAPFLRTRSTEKKPSFLQAVKKVLPSVSHRLDKESHKWDHQIDQAWSRRAVTIGESIPGTWAASEAAKILAFPKLSASQYPTLQKLLESSTYLSSKWNRKNNRIEKTS